MNIWRKIDQHHGNLLIFNIIWVMIWAIFLKVYKVYNVVYFFPSHKAPNSEIGNTSFFKFSFFGEYFSNPTIIVFLSLAIIPPSICYFLSSISSHFVSNENDKIRSNEIDALLNEIKNSNKQPEKLPKNRKKKKRTEKKHVKTDSNKKI